MNEPGGDQLISKYIKQIKNNQLRLAVSGMLEFEPEYRLSVDACSNLIKLNKQEEIEQANKSCENILN